MVLRQVPFARQVKGELARYMPRSRCCQLTELGTILRLEGSSRQTESGYEIEVVLSNPAATRKTFLLFKQLLGSRRLQLTRTAKGPGRRAYRVGIPEATGEELELLRAASTQLTDSDLALPERVCCRRALVRALVLCRGSFSEPERQNHFELKLNGPAADFAAQCFAALGIPVGRMHRRGGEILYIKDGDAIVALLQQTGAHNALLRYENVRIAKDVRNSINRVVNCETANVDKTVSAAMAQLEAIRRIDATVGLSALSPKLQEAARLRAKYPYATLQELAELTDPEVSRSTVRYRLERLMKIAEELPQHGK